ncbi:hypothetical protein [Dactylosporangium sp. CA-092794]|uniref:hypothetical protein n=1 Tax=Dactylosporangium sp. CA-092794 TaxID=3239929 RepID=UPI003D8E24B4
MKERKWRMRRSLLEREPVAALIGAIILVAIAVALIVGMFAKVAVPEVLANAFLVILGFFFGQPTSGGKAAPENGRTREPGAEG